MKSLGLVREEGGRWVRTSEAVTSPDDRVNVALQKGNLGLIGLAQRRVPKVPTHLRDVTSYIMAIDPSRLPEAKRAIRRLQDELSEILEAGEATEVYQLGVQLFPISRSESGS